jgi:hypothetical protein
VCERERERDRAHITHGIKSWMGITDGMDLTEMGFVLTSQIGESLLMEVKLSNPFSGPDRSERLRLPVFKTV